MSDFIYENTVDNNTWKVTVEQHADGVGILKVTKTLTNTIVHQQEVVLMYNAIFGPDADDLEHWRFIALNAIDNPSKRVIARV